MGLKITDSMLIKAKYELDLFQSEDVAYDIIEVIILDESPDEYTKGYLMAKLEEWADSLDGKNLLQQFVDYIEVVHALKR